MRPMQISGNPGAIRSLTVLSVCSVLMACLLVLAAPQADARSQADDLAAIARLQQFRFGADRAPLDAVAAIVGQSLTDPARRAAVARALMDVAASSAPFDARQFACRQLVRVASTDEIPRLTALLADQQIGQYACTVLSRIPGAKVGTSVLAALPKLQGGVRASCIALLAERRVPGADAAIAPLAADLDPDTGEAALDALAKLGGPIADRTLRRRLAETKPAARVAVAHALVRRAASLARTDAGGALALYRLLDDARLPESVQSAALLGSLRVRGTAAVPQLLQALSGSSRLRRNAAAQAARELPGTSVTKALAAGLISATPVGREMLLDALADRRDPAAVPAIGALLKTASRSARVRAIRAIGVLGDGTAVPVLLAAASSGASDARREAKAALVELRGRDVDARLTTAVTSSQPGPRAVAIEALGARGVAAPVDLLMRIAQTQSGAPQTAALRVLRSVGRFRDLPALVATMLALPPAKRDEASATIVAVARRSNPDVRAEALLNALRSARRSADRISLLAALGEIGGPMALSALREGVASADGEVALTALRALAEWPTAEPMDILLRTAAESSSSRMRSIALRGFTRSLSLPGASTAGGVTVALPGPRATSGNRLSALYREALRLSRTTDEKRLVLSGLATLGTPDALTSAADLAKDLDLQEEAELALIEIAHRTAGAWPAETRARLAELASNARAEEVRKRAQALMDVMGRFGDFVVAWEVSPAYETSGYDCPRLFDTVFAPETSAADHGWRAMPVGTSAEQPWLLDLLALHGGEQKVAYLRTAVWSEFEHDVIAEIGSDDGVKLWWNGQQVYANNTMRAVAPAQERVPLRARTGWNQLMMKITQNVMGWGACLRFVQPDGTAATGLRYAIPSALP